MYWIDDSWGDGCLGTVEPDGPTGSLSRQLY